MEGIDKLLASAPGFTVVVLEIPSSQRGGESLWQRIGLN